MTERSKSCRLNIRMAEFLYIYIYPPTSPERRACETTNHQNHPFLSKPQPGQPGPAAQSSQASAHAAQQDPCIHQPRQDAATSDQYLLVGAGLTRHRLPQAATACHRLPNLAPAPRQNPPNLDKSVLPPAQEAQLAHSGCPGQPSNPKDTKE